MEGLNMRPTDIRSMVLKQIMVNSVCMSEIIIIYNYNNHEN